MREGRVPKRSFIDDPCSGAVGRNGKFLGKRMMCVEPAPALRRATPERITIMSCSACLMKESSSGDHNTATEQVLHDVYTQKRKEETLSATEGAPPKTEIGVHSPIPLHSAGKITYIAIL